MDNQELVIYVKNARKSRSGTMSYEFEDGLNICSPYIIYKEKASAFSVNSHLNTLLWVILPQSSFIALSHIT